MKAGAHAFVMQRENYNVVVPVDAKPMPQTSVQWDQQIIDVWVVESRGEVLLIPAQRARNLS